MPQCLLQIDGGILLWIQNFLRCAVLDPIMIIYTQMGDAGILWIVLSVVLLCIPRTRKAGFVSLIAMLLGLLCTNVVLKHLVARPRPWLTVEGLRFLVEEHDPNSFPSGHTCAAFAAAGIWWRTLPARWARVTALVMAILMGLSRLYVGVHFPSDVLAGAAVGLLAAWIVWMVWRTVAGKKGWALR